MHYAAGRGGARAAQGVGDTLTNCESAFPRYAEGGRVVGGE